MAINIALKTAMYERGITQTDLGSLVGIHESRLSKISRGHVEASDEEKRKIAKALRKSVDHLFGSEVTL
jgi:transcriptional regulator with XRE-family HTH domain